MTKDLSRKQKILNIIVTEYIATAIPVASEMVQRNYLLGVSSATIRNDMANLEEEGFIGRPHTSAGCIPLDKGYRNYVETLSSERGLSTEEQAEIQRRFTKVADEVERWLKLAAVLTASLVGNAAVVTYPKASESKFKHLELVALHDFLGLLILVLNEASLKQQMITFKVPVTQDRLTSIANKLNAKYAGLTGADISAKKLALAVEEKQVSDTVMAIMAGQDHAEYDEPYMEGIRLMLSQPEFVKKESMLGALELLEDRDWLRSMFKRQIEDEKINVFIGRESGDESLKDLSLVLGRYGTPGDVGGTVGIIGPTRMDYQRAIATVGYIAEVLSYLLSDLCRES
jgi:heat-inducible transcriptional repressor